MSAARRVKKIHGAPSADVGAAAIDFTLENGQVVPLSIPADLLIGLGGLALSFRQKHQAELMALRVEAVNVVPATEGDLVLICTMGDRSMSLPLILSHSARLQLAAQLPR